MTDKHGFDKTQQIVPNLSLEIATMSSRSQVNSALHLHLPFDATEPGHSEVPTIERDGKLFIDTEHVRRLFNEAVDTNNPLHFPDILNLRQAVKNILSKKPAHIQGREIPPKTSADTVNAARMPRHRNPAFANTVRFEPFDPNKKQ
jgi:hypothetical protein